MSLLDLLLAGKVDEFNAQRGTRGQLELFASELAGLSLPEVDLSGANLDKSDLTETDFSDANLVRASMIAIDGEELVLKGAMAMGLRAPGAWLERADLDLADLTRADLAEAVLNGSAGTELRLTGARLKDAQAREVRWPGVDLSEARGQGADFTAADLTGANLTEGRFAHAILERAKLDGITGTNLGLQGAKLMGASLAGAKLAGANLAGADLTGADLSGADLTRANLTDVVLADARLKGALLVDACLDGVSLAGLDLEEVDLTGLDGDALGLSDEQVENALSVGSRYDPDAALRVVDPAVARSGAHIGVVWTNADDDTRSSLRWAVIGPEGERTGVLSYSAESVMADAIVAAEGGFEVVVVVDRPAGVTLARHTLSLEGRLGRAQMEPLGYQPGVRPALRRVGGVLHMWGMDGPGRKLVIHRESEDRLPVVTARPVPTARAMLGRYAPALLAKGGVVMLIDEKGVRDPMSTPEVFPTRISVLVPHQGRAVAVWRQSPEGRDPGGLRFAWLGGRGVPEIETLTRSPAVLSLDGWSDGESVWLAWTEGGALGEDAVLWFSKDGGTPERIPTDVEAPEEVRFLDATEGATLAVVTEDSRLVVLTLTGEVLADLGGEGLAGLEGLDEDFDLDF